MTAPLKARELVGFLDRIRSNPDPVLAGDVFVCASDDGAWILTSDVDAACAWATERGGSVQLMTTAQASRLLRGEPKGL